MFRGNWEVRVACSKLLIQLMHNFRNGGHINPPLWQDWIETKEQHGEKDAKMLINFRLAHVKEMHAVAYQEDIIKESQVRETEHVEVHMSQETFDEACEGLKAWKADMPEVASEYTTCTGAEAQEVSCVSGACLRDGY